MKIKDDNEVYEVIVGLRGLQRIVGRHNMTREMNKFGHNAVFVRSGWLLCLEGLRC